MQDRSKQDRSRQVRGSSPNENPVIQPADFSFGRDDRTSGGARDTRAQAQRKAGHPRRRQLVNATLTAGLIAGLIGVFWGLPQLVEPPRIQVAHTGAGKDDAGKDTAPAEKIKASPYSDAEIAEQRRQVQKVLQEILQLQEELRERKVEVWANKEFAAAQTLAEEADGIYRQRKFMRALEQYQAAFAAMQQLRDSIPARLEQHLAEGNSALDSGDAEGAHKAFDLVLTISEDHPRGVQGKARAEKLPQAWAQYIEGKAAFSAQNLDEARDALQASLATDPETKPAKELLPQVLAAINERDYSEAMSAGYQALGTSDFAAAKTAFQRAQKLNPHAPDPAAGLVQAENGFEQNRIDQLFARAADHERQEQWHQAAENYGKLLALDGSLVSAVTGSARAAARAQLDDQLEDLLKDPLTLGDSKRNKYARQVLADARQLNAGTPRLESQIEKLENALTLALIPIPVRLQSDSTTNVTIYRVGRLGIFDEREITLKPGRYTAVGTREGYRDVRREFTVDPATGTPTVVIQCAEKINGAING